MAKEFNLRIVPRWLMRGIRIGLGQGLGSFGNYMFALHPVYGPMAGLVLNSVSKAARDHYGNQNREAPWWARIF